MTFECNDNGIPDECELDCQPNGVPDDCDIAEGTSPDYNGNQVPDECELDEDCNGNGVQDIHDVTEGTSEDCNDNEIPDECEIDENSTAPGGPFYCDPAAPPVGLDECDPDCNDTGDPDQCDIISGTSYDTDHDGAPDECQSGVCCIYHPENYEADCVDDVPWDSCVGSDRLWRANRHCWDYEVCPPSACIVGVGDCLDDHGGLGCANLECCETVCRWNDYTEWCCEVAWDESCAEVALALTRTGGRQARTVGRRAGGAGGRSDEDEAGRDA